MGKGWKGTGLWGAEGKGEKATEGNGVEGST